MRFQISDEYQQYQYFLEVDDIRELKHVKLDLKCVEPTIHCKLIFI